MARVANNVLMNGMRGKMGDALVLKTMRGKTFASVCARKPDRRKESAAQQNTRVTFRQATEWAQMILLDAERKAYYQQRAKKLKLPNAYTAAITDYMRKPKVIKTQDRNRMIYTVSKPGFVLKQVRLTCSEPTVTLPNIATHQRSDRWMIHYTTTINSGTSFILMITDSMGRTSAMLV